MEPQKKKKKNLTGLDCALRSSYVYNLQNCCRYFVYNGIEFC